MALEAELKVFEQHLPEFRSRYPAGGFVVIKGEEILGIWGDRMDAIRSALKQYGNVAFLVKNIQHKPIPSNFSREIPFA